MANQSNNKSLLSFLADKFASMFYKLAPGWTKKQIDSLLLIPKIKDQFTVRVPRDLKQFIIKTKDGEIQAYRIGTGPAVIFVHGLNGGAYQFFPLMRGISQCGFTALTFDHFGHGMSESKTATLHQFIRTTNDVLFYVEKNISDGTNALVGHSTGCIAIANGKKSLIQNITLFLISPIFNYKLFFLKRLMRLKYPPELLKHYAAQFSKSYKAEYEQYELARNLSKYADVSLIAHDTQDKESPIKESLNFCQAHPITKLLITKEFDHTRIINSESVWQELKSHLNYEDTTINFMDQFNK